MRATIEIREQQTPKAIPRGFFAQFKKQEYYTIWVVDSTIDLTEEERAVLTQSKLWDKVLYMKQLEPSHFADMDPVTWKHIGDIRERPRTIKNIFARRPWKEAFDDPVGAKSFAHKMETEYLPLLKSYIVASTSLGGKKTVEF